MRKRCCSTLTPASWQLMSTPTAWLLSARKAFQGLACIRSGAWVAAGLGLECLGRCTELFEPSRGRHHRTSRPKSEASTKLSFELRFLPWLLQVRRERSALCASRRPTGEASHSSGPTARKARKRERGIERERERCSFELDGSSCLGFFPSPLSGG